MRSRSRCASTSRELAALRESLEVPDFTRLEESEPTPLAANTRASIRRASFAATSPVISRRRPSTSGGNAHQSRSKAAAPRRSRASRSESNQQEQVGTRTDLNGFTFQLSRVSPPRSCRLLKRHGASLDVSGEQQQPYVSVERNTEIANGRCSLCGSSPNKRQISGWTREVVREFVTGICGAELANTLYNEEIDGRCLLLMVDLGYKFIKLLPRAKLGPCLQLLHHLKNLQ